MQQSLLGSSNGTAAEKQHYYELLLPASMHPLHPMIAYPEWLHILAWAYIALSLASALLIFFDVARHRQKMWIMEPVWVISALYFSVLAVYWYLRTRPVMRRDSQTQKMQQSGEQPLQFIQVSVAVLHCGAGCTLGDVFAETLVPAIGLYFAGNPGSRFVLDFVFAYFFGIIFQYFTIAPMRNLSFGEGLIAAMRADTISITAFQIGMLGWMALTYFVLFPSPHLMPDEAVFWFMMQIAMMVGWATALPANRWLIKKGLKEKMPQHVPEKKRTPLPHAA